MRGTKGIKTEKLTLETLFTLVSEYNLWCYYTGLHIKFQKKINSPLRKDDNPSSGFFVSRTNSILLKDFGTGKAYSLFTFLRIRYGWTFYEALQHINSDFNLGYNYPSLALTNNKPVLHKNVDLSEGKSVKIKVKRGPWNKEELQYWADYHITKRALDKFNVRPLQCYWIVKGFNLYQFCRSPKELLFVFSFGNAIYKIYRPFGSKKLDKWFSNSPIDILMGYDELFWVGDTLIITKGMKELCILDELGYPTVALQGEGCYPPESLMKVLSRRFRDVYILLDNDKAGHIGMAYMRDLYGLKPIYLPDQYLPNGKDLAEISKMTDLQTIKGIIDGSLKTE